MPGPTFTVLGSKRGRNGLQLRQLLLLSELLCRFILSGVREKYKLSYTTRQEYIMYQ